MPEEVSLTEDDRELYDVSLGRTVSFLSMKHDLSCVDPVVDISAVLCTRGLANDRCRCTHKTHRIHYISLL